MLDHNEYTIEGNGYQGNGNGYHGLNGDWGLYYKVARGFVRRVKPEDRGDFLHDLLLLMAKVKAKYDAIGKPLTEAGLIRVACYGVADYWRKWYKRINGILAPSIFGVIFFTFLRAVICTAHLLQ